MLAQSFENFLFCFGDVDLLMSLAVVTVNVKRGESLGGFLL